MNYAVNISVSTTYGFAAMPSGSTYDEIFRISSISCYCAFSRPSTANIYATTAQSSDQFIDANKIATVTFSGASQGTVTVLDNGEKLSGKTYIGITRPDSKTSTFTVGLWYFPASTVKVKTDSGWQECYVKEYNGTEFVPCLVNRYDGTAFEECTHIVYE